MFSFKTRTSLPSVTFATSCWERDWRHILLDPTYLAHLQIGHHQFEFAERLLVINNVKDLQAVVDAAKKKVSEGILTHIVVAESIAQKILAFFQLNRKQLENDWIYYNALGPLAALYGAQSEYLLYHTGDVFLDAPVDWIGRALGLLQHDPRYKVANLTWNNNYAEAKHQSQKCCKGFYISNYSFSDQMFLVKRSDFCAPIYNEIRDDAGVFPRGNVFEKRIFSAMKNRGWLRLVYSKGSYIHKNFSE